MPCLSEQTLERLRVCVSVGIGIDPELARLILDEYEGNRDRIGERNAYIRGAAALVPGSLWTKAEVLAREAGVIGSGRAARGKQELESGTIRGKLHQAYACARVPQSQRQIYAIIKAY